MRFQIFRMASGRPELCYETDTRWVAEAMVECLQGTETWLVENV